MADGFDVAALGDDGEEGIDGGAGGFGCGEEFGEFGFKEGGFAGLVEVGEDFEGLRGVAGGGGEPDGTPPAAIIAFANSSAN